MPLCNKEAVLQRVADTLGCLVPELDPRWADLAAGSWRDAVADITSAFGLRAWNSTEIQSSDQMSSWHERLAFVYTMLRGVGVAEYPIDKIKEIDIRPMLMRPCSLSFNGQPMPPANSTNVGGITSGESQAFREVRDESAGYFR